MTDSSRDAVRLRPNALRAKYAIAFIWIVMAMEVLSLFSSYLQLGLLNSFQNGEAISEATAGANDTREALIGLLYLVSYIISAVTFIQWFRRAYFNLHLRVANLSQPESWAALGWFIPILSLFRPYQIMKELYRETLALLARKGVTLHFAPHTGLVGWWWALWVINSVLGQIVFRASMSAESVGEILFTTQADMVASAIGIPLGLITIRVIKNYADLEPLLASMKEEHVPVTPATIELVG